MQEIVKRFQDLYAKAGAVLPSDPQQQLEQAIIKVFDSWDNERSVEFRAINGISECSGTAINVQAMVRHAHTNPKT